MKNTYRYFNRDISWLSFNHRVLMEAMDKRLPLYERIRFIGIFSSNIEEFYQVRIASHKAVVAGGKSDDFTPDEARHLLEEMDVEMKAQFAERKEIYDGLVAELRAAGITFYQHFTEIPVRWHDFLAVYFREEVFPYLQPVKLEDGIQVFLRDNRLYLVVDVVSCEHGERSVILLKMPYSKVPRFIELPADEDNYSLMYLEDLIKLNLAQILPGYRIEGCYCCKISRDADVLVDELLAAHKIKQIKEKVKKRKIGAVARFVYEKGMPPYLLGTLIHRFQVKREECSATGQHLNLEDLIHFPIPVSKELTYTPLTPVRVSGAEQSRYMFEKISQRDQLFWYPYHSFDHFIQFLYEAVHDPQCTDIMITQYRVANHSAVINTLIAAAQNGKRVTVFVELKARFDEENNLETAEQMRKAGIHILFSIPGLKVHAKVALVLRRPVAARKINGFACISTGNFNEATATAYADVALFTASEEIVRDVYTLFRFLRNEEPLPTFTHLLISRFNLIDRIDQLIAAEIQAAQKGERARIILKMNALQDTKMIDRLYRASEAGVEVILLVRGICCLVPDASFSRNIRVLRVVDRFLEHTRIWNFYHGGEEIIYLGSPDWMRRNLYRRIEAVTPVRDVRCKAQILDFIHIQLESNDKTTRLDAGLRNLLLNEGKGKRRAQADFYQYLIRQAAEPSRPDRNCNL